jgi:hypothetical protein
MAECVHLSMQSIVMADRWQSDKLVGCPVHLHNYTLICSCMLVNL